MSRKSDLEKGNNKAELCDLVMELEGQVASATSGPLTTSGLISRKLQLAETAENAEVRVAQIRADKEEAIAAINVSSDAKEASVLGAVRDEYNGIKKDVTSFEKATESEIAELEAKATERKEAIAERIEKAEISAMETIGELSDKVLEAENAAHDEVKKIKLDHARDLDQVQFENKKAIRDGNEKHVTDVATELGLTFVNSDELTELKALVADKEDKTAAEVGKAVGMANAKAKADAEKAATKAEFESKLKLNALETALEAAKVQALSDKATITSLSDQVAKIPEMMEKIAAASQSAITVSQDAGKK